jgi:hypothetical protein
MLDFILTIAATYAVFAVLVAATPPGAERGLLRRQALLWLAAAASLAGGLVVLGGLAVQTRVLGDGVLEWNWTGKAAAIVLTLAMMGRLPGATRAEFGLTLRWTPGSVVPVSLVAAGLCSFSWGLQALLTEAEPVAVERLAYQALMPGLDEELFFRGLLLAVFLRIFPDPERSGPAPIGWAALCVTALFAIGHGLRITPDGIQGSAVVLAVTGLIGLGLLWIRRRSGTLIAPLFVHNLINLGNGFF